MRKAIILSILILFSTVCFLTSCREHQRRKQIKIEHADSLVNDAYKKHDYNQLLLLTEDLNGDDELSEMKALYWRGYAYSRQRKTRIAENVWQKAVSLEIHNDEDMKYYCMSANRLASVLLLRGEYEATMKVALPAMEKMKETANDLSPDYAYLKLAVGCCQLKMDALHDAEHSFNEAYHIYQELINEENSTPHFTSATVGVITITDNYLLQHRYQEAYQWTARLEELLQQYRQLPNPDSVYLDKQTARLHLYRASSLEGLGQEKEAQQAYEEAMKTAYAQTGDGKSEAINYLTLAKRWKDVARNYEVLDAQMSKYNMHYSLENIQRYLLPKYRANINANRQDTAFVVGRLICNSLDSAIISSQHDEAVEMATIYNTQQKETEIAQQRASISRQRFLVSVFALVMVIICFLLFVYQRHQAAKRLEIAYHKLEDANERIKESSRMKTSFIQQISHEIRTPLNILSGFTQVITSPDMELDEATRQDINQKILENTNRITELVNKMLELSDASSKTVIERSDDVLAVQIAAEAVGETMENENTCKIPIDLQIDKDVENVMMHTNEHAAKRIITLLLDNAERYTKEGSICLRLSQLDNTILFIVEDTGIGIPPGQSEHIFEEFVQLDEYAEGTGIGLTVARSLSRRLGGDIRLDTSYSKGARFIVSLPSA